ncbi:MAG TPA: hypothetical protein VJ249_08280 [Candidatus Bathyarchaeia archaeon]|nr:hypothetical protein [Candidatus Bathyarchaeia archaeon]
MSRYAKQCDSGLDDVNELLLKPEVKEVVIVPCQYCGGLIPQTTAPGHIVEFQERHDLSHERLGEMFSAKPFLNSSRRVMCTIRIFEKKAVATCLRFATSNTVRKQFYHYLLINGYVERVSRGVYIITQKGEKLLEILI